MTPPDGGGRRAEDAAAAAEAAAPLDLLLSDAALGQLRWLRPNASLLRLGLRLGRRPRTVARRAAALAGELGRIAAGHSAAAAAPRDRRFADQAWTSSPILRRIQQAYLAVDTLIESLLADADLGWRDAERAGFVVRNLVDAAAPSNNPLINPLTWKALIDTGGLSAVRGLRALASDVATAPRIPAMVAPGAFEVGRDLAVSPGAVVRRTDIFELIQYEPATPRVRQFPLVIVPPMINKFYICDLAPGRSMIEYLVSQGHQVFAISWRKPRRPAPGLGPGRLRAGSRRCAAHRANDLPGTEGQHLRAVLGWDRVVDGRRTPERDRPPGRAGFAVPGRDGARPDGGGHRGRAGRRAGRGAGRRGFARPRLPRRRDAGRGLRLAAGQRPDLELLGQQLSAGKEAAAVRHPVLERRHHPDAGGLAPRIHLPHPGQGPGQARRGDHARLAGRPADG